jgi:glucose/arabinose dehydrogenase
MPSRILRLSPSGDVDVIANEVLGGPRGISVKDDALYVSIKGGYFTQIVKYDLKTHNRTVLIDKLPNGGWHEPGGPIFGPDGLMYFGQGTVSLNGTIDPEDFTVDVAKHPQAHDIPGQDITLTGNNTWSRDPAAPYPFYVETGPFKPYGVPAKKGEVVKGEKFCSGCIMRSHPNGSDPELLAWGVRNPYGMAFNEQGELYVSDNDMEEKGSRAVGGDPDRVWHIKNVKQPYGSVKTPDWYGFPEYCADGLPVWHEKHKPKRGTPPESLIENPPPFVGPAEILLDPHTGETKMDFCRSDEFGYCGELFLAQWGTYAPLNSARPEDLNRGCQIVRINMETRAIVPFMHNRKPGAATAQGCGGIDHPVDCKFSLDGRSLYVLDFGVSRITKSHVQAFAHTGVLWQITRQ